MWKVATLWYSLRKELVLAWAMLRHPGTPRSAKLAILGAALYVLSPIDLVPDALPVLGWIDDGVVVALLLALAGRLVPAELHAALKARAAQRTAR